MATRKRPPIERFAEKTRPADNGCIEWIASTSNSGYGTFYTGETFTVAHRWSYEYHVGPIRAGMQVDHLCRNRLCVNPEHLEQVTALTNLLRGTGSAARTHCPAGHPYAGDNLRIVASTGYRVCITCRRANDTRRYHLSKKA